MLPFASRLEKNIQPHGRNRNAFPPYEMRQVFRRRFVNLFLMKRSIVSRLRETLRRFTLERRVLVDIYSGAPKRSGVIDNGSMAYVTDSISSREGVRSLSKESTNEHQIQKGSDWPVGEAP